MSVFYLISLVLVGYIIITINVKQISNLCQEIVLIATQLKANLSIWLTSKPKDRTRNENKNHIYRPNKPSLRINLPSYLQFVCVCIRVFACVYSTQYLVVC